MAFINTLIYNLEFPELSNKINIRAPKTIIIGTDEFDAFIHNNKIYDKIISNGNKFSQLKQQFVAGSLSEELEFKLSVFLMQIDRDYRRQSDKA